MNFGDNLRDLRKSRKMSQEQLAEKVNVSRQSISKWENGEAYPEMKNIMALCDIFNCKINDLVNDNITDTNSSDEDVKQVVIKFKEAQQKRMKLLSKITYIFAKISKKMVGVLVVTLILAILAVPFLLKDMKITDDTITILNNEIKYSVDGSNIITINEEKIFVETSTNLKEFIPNHSISFYIISVEYILVSFIIESIFLFLLLHNLEGLYKNIYDSDTPFTLQNIKYMKFIALFLGLQLISPKITATIYSLIAKLDLAIEYKLIDLVVIVIVISVTYIFKYGYEIQLDSNGKIYGNEENAEK